MILPPANLGIFGGGQLGRMFVTAARAMGYRTVVFDPDKQSPAGAVADQHLCREYDDQSALDEFIHSCSASTLEFENVPLEALQYVEHKKMLLYPAASAVTIAQDRNKEKEFINQIGVKTVRYHAVHQDADIEQGFQKLQVPLLLKTVRFGYDGKGQSEVANAAEAKAVFSSLGQKDCILEEKLTLKKEVSVLLVRDLQGNSTCYPIAENIHRQGILHSSMTPAILDHALADQVRQSARLIAQELNYCGVLAVEFFITDNDELYVNEIAPRPHNSGHYTIDACMTSQFAQQVRVMCGLSAGITDLLSPVVMVNILGDAWDGDTPPNWSLVLNQSNAYLHLYGKNKARPGRKMGHFCLLGKDNVQLLKQSDRVYQTMMNHAR